MYNTYVIPDDSLFLTPFNFMNLGMSDFSEYLLFECYT